MLLQIPTEQARELLKLHDLLIKLWYALLQHSESERHKHVACTGDLERHGSRRPGRHHPWACRGCVEQCQACMPTLPIVVQMQQRR